MFQEIGDLWIVVTGVDAYLRFVFGEQFTSGVQTVDNLVTVFRQQINSEYFPSTTIDQTV